MIAVAGCVAQAEGKEIIRRAPAVDLVVGPQSYHRLPDMLARAEHGKVVDTEFPAEDKFDHLAAPSRAAMRKRGVSAFVTVQEGCDKFCTFCVVPYTRGAEVSRPVAKIVAEAERLADAGVREITLIGQNVNAYHGEGAGRPRLRRSRDLLHRLAEVPGIARLRYTTSHPRDMDDAPDRRAPRPAGADAASASAGAVGLRPHARGDEPPPHRAPTISTSIERLRARAARHRVLVRLHRRLPGRDRGRISATRSRWSTRSATPAPTRSNIRRGPGTPAADMEQVPEAVKDERLQRLQARDRPPARRVQRALPRRAPWTCCSRSPAERPGQIVGTLALSAAGACHGAASIADRRDRIR